MPKGFGNHTQSCAFLILNIFIVLQIILGIVTIILNEYSKYTLSKYVGPEEAAVIQQQSFFLETYGLNLIMVYACGLLVVRKFRKEPYTTHLLTLLKVWHAFIFLISAEGFLTLWVIYRGVVMLMKSVELSLLRGVEVYYSNPEWRIVWDDMQYHQQCCGVQSYKDWRSTAWLEYDYEDNLSLSQQEPTDKKLLSLTPYSCCKQEIGCFENYLPQQTADNTFVNLPTLNLTSINQKGCLSMIQDEYIFGIYAQMVVTTVVFIFQILILLMMRIIFLRSDYCYPLQKINSESQTTFIVTCAKKDIRDYGNCTMPAVCPDEEDPPQPKNCECTNKRKVDFCQGEECSPLLIH